MPTDLRSILQLEVPLIVQIGERLMTVSEVIELVPGSIMEIPKQADEELEILVNNKTIGTGTAVKVGENFGIRVQFIGNLKDRIEALGSASATPEVADEFAELADQLLGGQ